MTDNVVTHQQLKRRELEELYVILKDAGANEKTLQIVQEEIDAATPDPIVSQLTGRR